MTKETDTNVSQKQESCDQKNPAESSGLFSRMQLNDNKAGMAGLDKQKINQVIYEASKGRR